MKKIQASTLLESIVALVILSIILSMTGMIFQSMWAFGHSTSDLKIRSKAEKTTKTLIISNDTQIQRIVYPHPNLHSLNIEHVVGVAPNGDTVFESKILTKK